MASGLRTRGGLKPSACVCFFALLLWAPEAAAGNVTRGCIERFDPAVDYFPEKATLEDARTFRVEYRKSYKVVTIPEPAPGAPPETYVLLQCGAPRPPLEDDLARAQIVSVPVSSLFAFSTTQLSPLVDLDRLDVLTGLAKFDFIAVPEIEARIRTGKVVEFARVELMIDAEKVVRAKPSVLMGTSAAGTIAAIKAAGVPVVANAEWLESTPLGRAEWLKYTALFLNEEAKAQALHAATKARYRAFAARAAAVPSAARPRVMTGRGMRGTFTIAGGRSYVAALIADAGGRYVWADNPSTGSATVDLEAQIRRAADAAIWINGGGWPTLGAMLQDEPRYALFHAHRTGQVWVYERRQQASGANDYWTRSVSRPDLVLADLLKIFHPALMNDHAFEWYVPVAAR